ncbi:hypothetical protein [Agarilytica rhodophyticola]|uniref:hypothetical protein n=1 Tax=Agarilytica rhodophyticola TaxID=1737490 RepID=UPI000CD913E3|nr:hypothetical protein [Agarilytica rhodophyticola]
MRKPYNTNKITLCLAALLFTLNKNSQADEFSNSIHFTEKPTTNNASYSEDSALSHLCLGSVASSFLGSCDAYHLIKDEDGINGKIKFPKVSAVNNHQPHQKHETHRLSADEILRIDNEFKFLRNWGFPKVGNHSGYLYLYREEDCLHSYSTRDCLGYKEFERYETLTDSLH